MTPSLLKLLLIEDDQAYSLGIETFLHRQAFVEDVRTTADGERALELLAEAPVDVVILDIGLPGLGGMEVCRRIVSGFGLPVLILTSQDDVSWVGRLWEMGASGYLHKAVALDHLEVALRSLSQGASWWDTTATSALRERNQGLQQLKANVTALPPLTRREGDVLVCLADGLTNNEIAAHLGITSGTVRIYLQTIFQKLGVTNRTQAVLRYLGRSEEGVRV
ncbi:response regulator transcription factor [Synechococcus sp. CBW1002]|nr:response regulator transcription factor [Synechococcus sp. CBW1002]